MAKMNQITIFNGSSSYGIFRSTLFEGGDRKSIFVKEKGLFAGKQEISGIPVEAIGKPKPLIVNGVSSSKWVVREVYIDFISREPNFPLMNPEVHERYQAIKKENESLRRRIIELEKTLKYKNNRDLYFDEMDRTFKGVGQARRHVSSFGDGFGFGGMSSIRPDQGANL